MSLKLSLIVTLCHFMSHNDTCMSLNDTFLSLINLFYLIKVLGGQRQLENGLPFDYFQAFVRSKKEFMYVLYWRISSSFRAV